MSLSADQYKQLDRIEHVLLRPDLYIGSISKRQRRTLIYSSVEGKIVEAEVSHSEAQEQTFIEILSNAGDNIERTRAFNMEKKGRPIPLGVIEVEMRETVISIKNGGLFIPITRSENGDYIPAMIFGSLLSGSSFDDTKTRTWIGRNGIGAKATNIFSKYFEVECTDTERKLKYKQVWKNNMRDRGEPEIEKYKGEAYTKITFSLDFPRFNEQRYDDEAISIYVALCCHVSYTAGVPVIFNRQEISVKSIVEYASLYCSLDSFPYIFYKEPGKYELCVVDTPSKEISISFVNGTITKEGGVHIDALYALLKEFVLSVMGKCSEGMKFSKRDIAPHLSIFLSCRVKNPEFKSQIKDYLTSPKIQITIPDKELQKMKKWKLFEILRAEIDKKHLNKLKKTDGKRCRRVDVPKVEEANLVVQNNGSREATLILIEGDSANSYAVKFMGHVPNRRGHDIYGSYPLTGKILNTINAPIDKVYNNKVLCHLKKILGLEEGVNYSEKKNYNRLRYGGILIMTDADNDGKHILGLILIYFMKYFKELVDRGFIKFLRTPVVRLLKTGKKFYTMSSFHRWAATVEDPSKYQPKYYKGLGTTPDEHIALDYNDSKIVVFKMTEESREKILLAFDKTMTQERKEWISKFVDKEVLEFEECKELPIETFIDYELISYSIENVIRAIPEAMDGLKESQRKVLFGALDLFSHSKNQKKSYKTTQIASHSDMITCYKHGPQCLAGTITKMAQDFVGSNNMPYFKGEGQFGSRDLGGADAASPRYTEIAIPWWHSLIFRKEDRALERRIIEDGEERECENFYPILPLHVINGQCGVGSGWNTFIPSHHPLAVALWFKRRLRGETLPSVMPWYRGFTGEIKLTNSNGYCTFGKFNTKGKNLIIDELPIEVWTKKYYKFLQKFEEEGLCKTVTSHSDGDHVLFTLHDYKGKASYEALKLVKQKSFNNMTLLYRGGNRGVYPIRYNSIQILLEDFYKMRLKIYEERKESVLNKMKKDISSLDEKIRFIKAIRDEELIITGGREENEVLEEMKKMGFSKNLLEKVSTANIVKKSSHSVELLEDKLSGMIREMEIYSAITIEDLWFDEIEEFIAKYCKENKCQPLTVEDCLPYPQLTPKEEEQLPPVEEEEEEEEGMEE